MKAPKNYEVTAGTVKKLVKEATRAKAIESKIAKLKKELDIIVEGNNWTNYLHANSCTTLTEEEEQAFIEAIGTIRYANR